MSGPRDYSAGTRAALAALSAGTCYYPSCAKSIIQFIDGEPYIDYQIAHIRDARPGNRYDPAMTDDERRSFANLVLLCKPHHTLVDKTHPDRFSSDDLQRWKDAREREGIAALAGLQELTEERLEQLILDAVTSAGDSSLASAVVGVAKAAAQLTANLRESRKSVASEVASWRQTWERTRRSLIAWDPETGERLYAEPPAIETDRHRQAVELALREAVTEAAPSVATVRAEIAAVRAASVELRPWCDAAGRALEAAMQAAQHWPLPPPFEDDGALEDALAELAATVDNLTAKWRGEVVPEPTPPEPPPVALETDAQRTIREHKELLEGASRYRRAHGLPYDRRLAMRLLQAASLASTLPPVPSLWPFALDTTAALVAAVGRNSDDTEFGELIDRCLASPVDVGVFVARHLGTIARDAGDEARTRRAQDAAEALLRRAEWADERFWQDIETYGRDLLFIDAAMTSPPQTAALLESALVGNDRLLPWIVRGCAQWSEQRDSRDFTRLLGYRRAYSEIPAWFPTEAVVNAIRTRLPHVVAHQDPPEDTEETEALAAQILHHAAAT